LCTHFAGTYADISQAIMQVFCIHFAGILAGIFWQMKEYLKLARIQCALSTKRHSRQKGLAPGESGSIKNYKKENLNLD
jgi:hypothetical protein